MPSSNPTDGTRLSHKQWKKQRRKLKRQHVAQARDENLQADEAVKQASPRFREWLAVERAQEADLIRQEEFEKQRCHQLWLQAEHDVQEKFKAELERVEREKQRLEEQERKIKEEWEERQKKDKEQAEELEKKKKKQVTTGTLPGSKYDSCDALNINFQASIEALLKEATANENKNTGEAWHNPLAPANVGKEQLRPTCPFFKKVACCRFGDRCSRSHPDPGFTTTIMFPGMYFHFELDHSMRDDCDTDITLEYEDNEMIQHFREFYDDTVAEFKTIGKLIQFKVCCNYEVHLRGNVYVQYDKLEDAQMAVMRFNGRWYAGKQLSPQFVDIEKWKAAICGLFGRNRCPKGKNCNFLHVFRNPRSEFIDADNDFVEMTPRYSQFSSSRDNQQRGYNMDYQVRRHQRTRSRSRTREKRWNRSRSRSPSRSERRRSSRSRSPSRSKHHRSRSRGRYSSRRRSRSRSCSRSEAGQSRSTKRSYSRSRSQSRDSVRKHSVSFKDNGVIDKSIGGDYNESAHVKDRHRSQSVSSDNSSDSDHSDISSRDSIKQRHDKHMRKRSKHKKHRKHRKRSRRSENPKESETELSQNADEVQLSKSANDADTFLKTLASELLLS